MRKGFLALATSLLVFSLAGPVTGAVVTILLYESGMSFKNLPMFLPWEYIFGVVPALFAGFVNFVVAESRCENPRSLRYLLLQRERYPD